MPTYTKSELEHYLVQLRRIEEHREADAEREIRKIYKALLKDLKQFLGVEYADYAQDDKLTYEVLRAKGEYARFLEEVEIRINNFTPRAASEIRNTVEDTYKAAYQGMVTAVERSNGAAKLHENLEGIRAITPEIVKRAVENPISGLTLDDTLEKNRREVIYDIKQQIGIGLSQGDRMSTMARRITDRIDIDYRKATRIVRTEAHRVREAGYHDCATEIDDVLSSSDAVNMVMTKTWRTMKDEAVRPQRRARKGKNGKVSSKRKTLGGPNHMKMEGKTVAVKEKFDLGGGVKTDAPGQSGVAGHDINCRCYLEYDLMTREEFEKRSEKRSKGLSAKVGGGDIPEHESPVFLKKINGTNMDDVKKELQRFEKNAIIEPIETACVITKDGEVYQCFGTANRVFPDYDLGEKLRGAAVSHNHPIDETEHSFSSEDINLFLDYDLTVLRGCDEEYKYELTRNSSDIDEEPDDWMNFENFRHANTILEAQKYGIGYRRWRNDKR